ncbi:MAG: prolyl oligopeptidase family serine peptidase, partial [Gemmatimonadaceae bacterium]
MKCRSCLLLAISPMLLRSATSRGQEPRLASDPFYWLEDVQSKRSLEWVSAQTAITVGELTRLPQYPALYADIRHVFDLPDVIAYPQIAGDRIYTVQRDADHRRGLWRRTSWDDYLRGVPKWETILDLDSLAIADEIPWTLERADCLEPDHTLCLLELSRDGSDSTEIFGLDVVTRKFVTLEASMLEPKPKPTRLARAELPNLDATPQKMRISAPRRPAMVRKSLRDQAPADGDVFMVLDQVIVYLHEPWEISGTTWPPGSIIATSLADFLGAKRNFALLMKPGVGVRIVSVCAMRDYLLVYVLSNASGELRRYRHDASKWRTETIRAPKMGTVEVISSSTMTNRFFFSFTTFLQPTTLYVANDDGRVQEVKRLPSSFSSADLTAEQGEAVSRDGTKIPFFIVHRSALVRDGNNPTLLYAYGGFDLSSTPGYGTAVGPAWIGRGGVYVVANVRGGGEFGPDWHTAATRENRQRAYDDFTAVAEELIREGITSPRRLGIIGASNGGLLAGVALTERPDLYNAAVIQSALLDMRRYSHLLGGASWIPEFGDPDKPEDWAYMSKYSPYQNLKPDTRYPPVMFATNMLDDRVHPGHVRKMAAKMESMGQPVYYFENAHGDHGGGLTADEKAKTLALAYAFLW